MTRYTQTYLQLGGIGSANFGGPNLQGECCPCRSLSFNHVIFESCVKEH
jgi:hypothetical protein